MCMLEKKNRTIVKIGKSDSKDRFRILRIWMKFLPEVEKRLGWFVCWVVWAELSSFGLKSSPSPKISPGGASFATGCGAGFSIFVWIIDGNSNSSSTFSIFLSSIWRRCFFVTGLGTCRFKLGFLDTGSGELNGSGSETASGFDFTSGRKVFFGGGFFTFGLKSNSMWLSEPLLFLTFAIVDIRSRVISPVEWLTIRRHSFPSRSAVRLPENFH